LWDDQEEARFVVDEVEAWQRQGGRLNQAAVLVRAGFQTRSFEERFIQLGVAYRVVGGPRFYERAEVRDAIAYLRVVCQPDDDLALERIANLPRRGIGDSTLRSLRAAARAAQISLFQAARVMADTDELPARARNALHQLLGLFDRWRGELRERPPRELTERILDESGYTAMWQAERTPDAPGRLENLKELVKAVQEFETLPAFLEHVSLVMDNAATAEGDMVSIMTLHGAKGLEFDNVFLAGWEDGLFPNQRAVDEGGTKALEEERRLAYVGITRARRRLTVSFAANRRVYNQWSSSVPSRFVDELPPEHLEHLHRNPATRPDLGTFLDDEPFTARPTSRFRSRRAELGKLIEGKAEILQSRPPGRTGSFKPGDRIFHDKFGYGKVEQVDGNKLDIAFEHSGRKKVIDSFVQPA
jgi:DNA helicase II / ATP-dependent DNA helicase PcrA